MKRSDASSTSANHTFQSRNPHFGYVDNGPYQLGHLVRNLPPHGRPITEDDALKLDAVRQHAYNGSGTVVRGLEAIGALMVRVGASEDGDLGAVTMLQLGDLIQYLAVEVRYLHELEGSAEDRLREDAQREVSTSVGGVRQ